MAKGQSSKWKGIIQLQDRKQTYSGERMTHGRLEGGCVYYTEWW